MAELRALGQELSREKLLDLVLNAKNEIRLRVYVSLARPGMDYEFFQMLSEKISQASADERQALEDLRTSLLDMTREVDRQMEAHAQEVRQAIDAILQSPNPVQVLKENMQVVDEVFLEELEHQIQDARKQGNLERSAKLQQMMETIQEASVPPEWGLVQEYLNLPDEQNRQDFLDENADQISEQFLEMVANINAQVQGSGDQQTIEHVRAANRQALRFSMQRTVKG